MGYFALAIICTFAVALAVMIPLFSRMVSEADTHSDDGAGIYRDQLHELDRDRADGRVDERAYEASRAEIARRLIAVEKLSGKTAASNRTGRPVASRHRLRWLTAGVIVLGFAAAGSAYTLIGAPFVRDQPLAARIDSDNPDLPVLVARVETHLAQHPDDGRGWELLAPIYARQMRFEAARNAYVNAVRVLGPDPNRLVGLGEVIVAEASGVVTDEALEIFRRADALGGQDLRADYYIALAVEQSGRYGEALERFESIRAQSPSGSLWLETVDRHIARNQNMLSEQGTLIRGPDAQAVRDAEALSQTERIDMIAGMVDSLAARLEENPGDMKGWMQLIRSYVVLGKKQDALDALREARAVFEGDHAGIERLAVFADQLGLGGETQ